MNINFNISPSLVKRTVEALERLVEMYATVNAPALDAAQARSTTDKRVGTSYYQSDAAVYAAEQEARARQAIERGEI